LWGGFCHSRQYSEHRAAAKPAAIIPDRWSLGGAQPQPNGLMWLLAGSSTAKTPQELNVTTGKIALIVPESASAVSVAQLSSGSSVSVLQLRRPDP